MRIILEYPEMGHAEQKILCLLRQFRSQELTFLLDPESDVCSPYGNKFFFVDQFKLMPVKWSFPPRFHDSTVHVLVIFLVYSIRSVHIILLDLIPVMP